MSNPAKRKNMAARLSQDMGSVRMLIQNTRFVRINGTNTTKEGKRVERPPFRKLLVRQVTEAAGTDSGSFV